MNEKTKGNTCVYCGSSHKSELCHMKKWADYLTGKAEEAPEGRTLIVAEGEDELINAIQEAHALKHIKKSKRRSRL